MTKLTITPLVLLSPLLSSCGSPQPTGTIAFSSDRDGNAEICIFNADATGLERLTYTPSSDTNPAWSPDGQHIAYNQEYEGNLDVCIMHTDGPATNLTGWPGAEGSPPGLQTALASPSVPTEMATWRSTPWLPMAPTPST